MQLIELVKKTLINSQIFVSLMGTLLAVFFMLHNQNFQWNTTIVIFTTYFCGYIYTKFQNTKYFLKVLILNLLLGTIILFLIIKFRTNEFLFKWLIIIFLGLFYNSKFLFKYIREIPLIKIFYVGLMWALVNSWLIFPEFKIGYFGINFLFISTLILPFDIRDINQDKIITFPKIIGVQNTKYLAYILMFLACLISFFTLNKIFAIAFFLTTIVSFILIYFSTMDKKDFYYSFGVELCGGLPFLFLILMK